MNGFVSSPIENLTPDDETFAVDGWFPPIELAELRDKVRIGEGAVTNARLIAAVEGAVLTALRNLKTWRSNMAVAGMASLDDIPGDTIGDRKIQLVIWERIIRFYAAAEIADGYRDISATDQGDTAADDENITADDYRRMANNAVNDMLSISLDADAPPVARNRVELI